MLGFMFFLFCLVDYKLFFVIILNRDKYWKKDKIYLDIYCKDWILIIEFIGWLIGVYIIEVEINGYRWMNILWIKFLYK